VGANAGGRTRTNRNGPLLFRRVVMRDETAGEPWDDGAISDYLAQNVNPRTAHSPTGLPADARHNSRNIAVGKA
jgi:hypothetical protein